MPGEHSGGDGSLTQESVPRTHDDVYSMNARASSGASGSADGDPSAASHDYTTSATDSDLSTLSPIARSVFEAVTASGVVLHGSLRGGDCAGLNEIAFIDMIQANHHLFEPVSEVGIRALGGKRCKSIKMNEQKEGFGLVRSPP
jgi:hypothetical protein